MKPKTMDELFLKLEPLIEAAKEEFLLSQMYKQINGYIADTFQTAFFMKEKEERSIFWIICYHLKMQFLF